MCFFTALELVPLLPWAGAHHSRGTGAYNVSEGKMTFGKPTKYLPLSPHKAHACDWDQVGFSPNQPQRRAIDLISFAGSHPSDASQKLAHWVWSLGQGPTEVVGVGTD
jgi:hypothetical protein